MDGATPLVCRLSDGNAAGRFPWGWAGCAQPRGAILRRWPAMGAAQRRPRPPCGRANAPRLEIGRRNCGRAFPVGWGLAGMGGLRPTAWHGSGAMGGDARGNGFLMDVKTPLVWRLGDGKAAGSFRGVGVGGLRPAPWRNSAAMRTAQRRKWPPFRRYNAPRLEIGRQKTGRGLPGGWGTAHHF